MKDKYLDNKLRESIAVIFTLLFIKSSAQTNALYKFVDTSFLKQLKMGLFDIKGPKRYIKI
jgi:hypothetical protein